MLDTVELWRIPFPPIIRSNYELSHLKYDKENCELNALRGEGHTPKWYIVAHFTWVVDVLEGIWLCL